MTVGSDSFFYQKKKKKKERKKKKSFFTVSNMSEAMIIEEGSNALKFLCIQMHTIFQIFFFRFQSPNSQSEPLDAIYILRCAWRPNFTFFEIFLLFIKPLWKSLILHFLDHWISDFQSGLINSKKIPKNVKFGLQAHLNI